MGRSGSPKRFRHTALLPQELMHVIFEKLDLKDKLNVGLVCKQWDQLLKAGTADARHWRVDYNLDTIWSSTSLKTLFLNKGHPEERLDTIIERWFVNRAAAIESVHVTATLSSDKEGVAKRSLVRRHLPYVVGTLSKYNNSRLHLSFLARCPSLLSSSAFSTLLCPMVTTLSLMDLSEAITPTHFAAICELTNLEELTISAVEDEVGLEELTSDVSKLVNLKVLTLAGNNHITYIPESISCLKKLEDLYINEGKIMNLPASLGTLTTLTSLGISWNGEFSLPLNVQGLENLTAVTLAACELEMIPEELAGLPALTSLDVSGNAFNWPEGWPWWPTNMSRLTQLKSLAIARCYTCSIPPHITVFRQLTKLDASYNGLKSLPDELCSLVNFKELVLLGNKLCVPPISILTPLRALTAIDLRGNFAKDRAGRAVFKIPSSLLPILHPGLVYLDLRQFADESDTWDSTSMYHLGRAVAEVADRRPVPTLLLKT